MPSVDLFGASEAVLDQGIGSGESDNLLTGFAFLLNHLFHMYSIPDPLTDVKGLGGVFPKFFVLAVEQREDFFRVVVPVNREESVDHKLTNALVLLLSSLGSGLESGEADGVFLTFHAPIIPRSPRNARGK